MSSLSTWNRDHLTIKILVNRAVKQGLLQTNGSTEPSSRCTVAGSWPPSREKFCYSVVERIYHHLLIFSSSPHLHPLFQSSSLYSSVSISTRHPFNHAIISYLSYDLRCLTSIICNFTFFIQTPCRDLFIFTPQNNGLLFTFSSGFLNIRLKPSIALSQP
jgi:hypothetical protein